jgi:hypothetical protein
VAPKHATITSPSTTGEHKMFYKNAKITSTKLGALSERGIMNFWIMLDYGDGCHQGLGGYALDSYDKEKGKRAQTKLTGELVFNILNVLELDSWEDLNGKYIRAIMEGANDFSAQVVGVAHIIKDQEFNFKKHVEQDYNRD